MNNQTFFSPDLVDLLLISEEVSKRLKVSCLTRRLLLGILALRENNSFHGYLLKHNMDDEQIAEKITEFWQSDIPKMDSTEKVNLIVDGHTFIISAKLLKTFNFAIDLAKKSYNTNTVNQDFVFAALTETYTEEYLDLLISCLGVDAEIPETVNDNVPKKDLIIPKKLSSFLYILNENFSPTETECNILGREEETNQLIRILSKATKRNAILIGEPGVGKTAIVEKLAWQITTSNCPEKFKNLKIIVLEVNSILAGTQYRGSAEQRFDELIKFLEQNPDCILFIDEIHTILGAGACRDGDLDLANALKPILARGETRVIGATTSEEYEKYFSKDGALKRRFEKIIVKEPHSDEVYDMIKNQISRLEEFHNTVMPKELIDFTILNASCFNYETKNPDRTLDLIDKSMATAELANRHFVSREDILSNFAIRKKQFENMSNERKMAIAYHESGHYILHIFSAELRECSNTLAVSIMPAEGYLGVNVEEGNENYVPSNTKSFYIQQIGKLLAGRIAEKMYSSEITSGARSDSRKATEIAKNMVMSYGLSNTFGNHVYEKDGKNLLCDNTKVQEINKEIDGILVEAEKYATVILNNHKKELELIVEGLMQNGILSKKDLDKILTENKGGLFIKKAIGSILINR